MGKMLCHCMCALWTLYIYFWRANVTKLSWMNIGKVDGTLFVIKALSFFICPFKITK